MNYRITCEDGSQLVEIDSEALKSVEDLIHVVAEAERERCAGVLRSIAAGIDFDTERECFEAAADIVAGIAPAEGVEVG